MSTRKISKLVRNLITRFKDKQKAKSPLTATMIELQNRIDDAILREDDLPLDLPPLIRELAYTSKFYSKHLDTMPLYGLGRQYSILSKKEDDYWKHITNDLRNAINNVIHFSNLSQDDVYYLSSVMGLNKLQEEIVDRAQKTNDPVSLLDLLVELYLVLTSSDEDTDDKLVLVLKEIESSLAGDQSLKDASPALILFDLSFNHWKKNPKSDKINHMFSRCTILFDGIRDNIYESRKISLVAEDLMNAFENHMNKYGDDIKYKVFAETYLKRILKLREENVFSVLPSVLIGFLEVVNTYPEFEDLHDNIVAAFRSEQKKTRVDLDELSQADAMVSVHVGNLLKCLITRDYEELKKFSEKDWSEEAQDPTTRTIFNLIVASYQNLPKRGRLYNEAKSTITNVEDALAVTKSDK